MRLPFNGTYAITQRFGANPADYKRFGIAGHNGIDYALPLGAPVVAAVSGTAQVLNDPAGFGLYITVTSSEYKTLYAHLSKAAVFDGQNVQEGQVIGYSGNSGNSTGPHLHFGVRPINYDNSNGYFGYIDPQRLNVQGAQTMARTEKQWLEYEQQLLHGPGGIDHWINKHAEVSRQLREAHQKIAELEGKVASNIGDLRKVTLGELFEALR